MIEKYFYTAPFPPSEYDIMNHFINNIGIVTILDIKTLRNENVKRFHCVASKKDLDGSE